MKNMQKKIESPSSGSDGNGSSWLTLAELAVKVNGAVVGDGRTRIQGAAGLREAGKGDITFLSSRRYAALVGLTKASAIIVAQGVDLGLTLPTITVKNPDIAFAVVAEAFAPRNVRLPRVIHPSAIVADDAHIGKDVAIGAYAVVESGARIGDGTTIYPLSYIGHGVAIGNNCTLYPRVVLRERVALGNNVVIHSGAVIGSDGFGYHTENGVHRRIPQTGTVLIEDDVEVGANTTIDRARFDKTIIRRGVKLDNLVQIGHNVVVGDHTIIAAQSGIAGSARIGKYVRAGGQSGVNGHVEIGDQSMLAARAGVTKSLPPRSAVSGVPAAPHARTLREQGVMRKLPEMHAEVRGLRRLMKEIEERIATLEKTAKDHQKSR